MRNIGYNISNRTPIPLGLVIVLFMLFNFNLGAQGSQLNTESVRTRILFLLDGSGSMQNKWNESVNQTKMYSAKKTLAEIVDSLDKFPNVEIALRVYGHQSMPTLRNCKDTKLEVGFSRNSSEYIRTTLETIRPKGITPIAYSLEKAGEDFPDLNGRNIIILMTDGEESCDGDPCAVAMMLEKRNIVLKHFVIGIGVEESSKSAFDCIGSYFRANDQTGLKQVLNMIISRVMNKTTTQVNLLDKYGYPKETDVNVSFYNDYNRVLKYDFYHSLDATGRPDTLSVDPVNNYTVVAHTLPPIYKEGITLNSDQHNVISLPASQGNLAIKLIGNTLYKAIKNKVRCLVRKHNDDEIINVQNFNSSEKYVTGKYDLEMLTLPRTYISNVDISQNKTTSIDLASPGIVNVIKKYEVYGGIFLMKGNQLEKVYALNSGILNETVALNPGTYYITYRAKSAKSMHNSKTIEFTIKSGESIPLNL